jgi:glutamate-1-semialdehyde aminotransferase
VIDKAVDQRPAAFAQHAEFSGVLAMLFVEDTGHCEQVRVEAEGSEQITRVVRESRALGDSHDWRCVCCV